MRPVNLVGLANDHIDAVLPNVGLDELRIIWIVELALESLTISAFERTTTIKFSDEYILWTCSRLVVFTNREVFGTEMPVNVDGAHSVPPIWSRDGVLVNLQIALVTLGNVGTSLRANIHDGVHNTLNVGQIRLLSFAGVHPSRWFASCELLRSRVDDNVGCFHGNSHSATVAVSRLDTESDRSGQSCHGNDRAKGNESLEKGGVAYLVALGSSGDRLLVGICVYLRRRKTTVNNVAFII
jgi:hypothetical protein